MRGWIPTLALLSVVACASPGGVAYTVRGSCASGIPDGPFELVLPSGRAQVTGSYLRGAKEGLVVIYSSAGPKVAEVPYHDDAFQGTIKLWYMPESSSDAVSRRKLETSYASGLREGPSLSWYPDGTPRKKATYAEERLVTIEAWDDSGVPLSDDQARRMAAFDEDADRKLYSVYEQVIRENPVSCAGG
jgi:antitoxin component YwqK of YwqJK toxin-antitoxin module